MLRDELLKAVKRLELIAKKEVDNQLIGQYQSAFKGRGMDFADVREYQPGDDIRVIDWNVSARMNDLHVKQFTEERQLVVLLAVDISGSQAFGTRSQTKREIASELAAVIAFAAMANNDQVGLLLFTDQNEKFIPPKQGRKHALRLVTEILDFETERKQTDIAGAFEYLANISSHRTLTFFLSDFLDDGYENNLRIMQRRHDVVPVVIQDPVEAELPEMGLVQFEDPETGEVRTFDTTSESGREAFRDMRSDWHSETLRLFRRYKMTPITIDSDKDHIQPLLEYFRDRSK